MSQNKLKQNIFSGKKINPLLILVKEKEQTVRANNVVVLSAHTPILNGIVFLVTGKFFSRNQVETRQQDVHLQLASLVNLRCVFTKLLMYEHYPYNKMVHEPNVWPHKQIIKDDDVKG